MNSLLWLKRINDLRTFVSFLEKSLKNLVITITQITRWHFKRYCSCCDYMLILSSREELYHIKCYVCIQGYVIIFDHGKPLYTTVETCEYSIFTCLFSRYNYTWFKYIKLHYHLNKNVFILTLITYLIDFKKKTHYTFTVFNI